MQAVAVVACFVVLFAFAFTVNQNKRRIGALEARVHALEQLWTAPCAFHAGDAEDFKVRSDAAEPGLVPEEQRERLEIPGKAVVR